MFYANQGQHAAMARMSEKLVERMGHRGGRVDMAIQDWKSLGKNSAKILASYNPAFGAPTSQVVASWVVGTHSGKLVPHIDTLRYHPNLGAFSLVVSTMTLTRPGKDKNFMAPVIAGMKYLDQDTGTNWVLSESSNGKEILKQDVDMDVNAILASSSALTTASMRMNMVDHGVVMRANIGDKVNFFHNGMTKKGQVISASETGYRMATDKGTCTATLDSVIEITAAGEETQDLTKQELVDFYTRCYGDRQFAADLVEASLAQSDVIPPVEPVKPQDTAEPVEAPTTVEPEKGADISMTGSLPKRKVGLKASQVKLNKKTASANSPVTLMKDGLKVSYRDVTDEDQPYKFKLGRPRHGYEKSCEGSLVGYVKAGGKSIPVRASASALPLVQSIFASDQVTAVNIPDSVLDSSDSPADAARKLGLAGMTTAINIPDSVLDSSDSPADAARKLGLA